VTITPTPHYSIAPSASRRLNHRRKEILGIACRWHFLPCLTEAVMRSPVFAIIGVLICAMELCWTSNLSATPTDIVAPPGSVYFGQYVAVLPNGNLVVTDSQYNNHRGRVYLYDGASLALINTMSGTTAGDFVGSDGITVLPNGNYIVRSTRWSNGRGAVTYCNTSTGCPETIQNTNSFVGPNANDRIGSDGITILPNGNFVILSEQYNTGAGAATWCDGTTGCTGTLSAENSRIGIESGATIVFLANGNYVIVDPFFGVGPGAVMLCRGTEPCTGYVSTANSLIGTSHPPGYDYLGLYGIVPLTNGNYVIRVVFCPNGDGNFLAGVTFCNGLSGCTGTTREKITFCAPLSKYWIGSGGIAALSNGNYVVSTPEWPDRGNPLGAATICNGATGCSGMEISSSNSLVGSTIGDSVGSGGVIALSNAAYVVNSPNWSDPATFEQFVGASTFCDADGCTGAVSASKSLVGSSPSNRVGTSAVSLGNGNYVVVSKYWGQAGVIQPGAVTFCNGQTGCSGEVSTANSLVNASMGDLGSVKVLNNGNYIVNSPYWDNGAAADVGAVTFCSGTSGCIGEVSSANSLIGSTAGDEIGFDYLQGPSVQVLMPDNYVLVSIFWDNGVVVDAGAVTTCSAVTGCRGAISPANSLVGSHTNDFWDRVLNNPKPYGTITGLPSGDYILQTFVWNNAATVDAGAVTYCLGNGKTIGPIRNANSVLGTTTSEGVTLSSSFDATRDRLFVGRPVHNTVTIMKPNRSPKSDRTLTR
jgi:hypothetical protein